MAKFVEKIILLKKQMADKRIKREKDERIQHFLGLVKDGRNVSGFLQRISLSEKEDRIENYERLKPYEEALASTYNRDRIVELLKKESSDDFFKSGWFYQTAQEMSYECYETGENIVGFEYRSCLPKDFWLDEELVKLFLNQAEKYRYDNKNHIYQDFLHPDLHKPYQHYITLYVVCPNIRTLQQL